MSATRQTSQSTSINNRGKSPPRSRRASRDRSSRQSLDRRNLDDYTGTKTKLGDKSRSRTTSSDLASPFKNNG